MKDFRCLGVAVLFLNLALSALPAAAQRISYAVAPGFAPTQVFSDDPSGQTERIALLEANLRALSSEVNTLRQRIDDLFGD